MKATFFIVLLFLCAFTSSSQSIFFEYGFNRPRSILERPMEYSYNNFEEQNETMCVGYEQCISKRKNLYLSFDYLFKYLSGSNIVIRNPETTDGGFGKGTTRYSTYSIGLKYQKGFFEDRLNLSTGIYLKIVDVVRTWPDSSMTYWDPIEYYPYSGISYSIAYPGTYFVPEVRLAIGVRFLWRMHFYLNMAYAQGFSKTQDLVWEYSYKGVPQPKAVAYVNGTELRFHLGLKFDIVRCKKKDIGTTMGADQKRKRKYK